MSRLGALFLHPKPLPLCHAACDAAPYLFRPTAHSLPAAWSVSYCKYQQTCMGTASDRESVGEGSQNGGGAVKSASLGGRKGGCKGPHWHGAGRALSARLPPSLRRKLQRGDGLGGACGVGAQEAHGANVVLTVGGVHHLGHLFLREEGGGRTVCDGGTMVAASATASLLSAPDV